MKIITKAVTRVIGLTAVLSTGLISFEAAAVGTLAGTDIANIATVNYDVGGVAQPAASSDPATATFTVDNRVDFSLTQLSSPARTLITPGQANNWVSYTLANLGNAPQSYALTATALATLDFTMTNPRAFADSNGNGTYDPGVDVNTFVGDIQPDNSTTIFVVGDAPAGLTTGDQSDIQIDVETADAGSNGGTVTTGTTGGDTTGVDVVLAVGGVAGVGSNTENAGFQVEVVNLVITKSVAIISDPFSSGGDGPFAIPGAVVEYTISVQNPSASISATAVQISDALTDVEVTAGATVTYTNATLAGDGTPGDCSADIGDGDGDGCGIDSANAPHTMTFGNGNADFTIAPNTTATFVFQATIL